MNYRYEINGEMYSVALLLSTGDVINIKEVFGLESDKEAYKVDQVIWRRSNDTKIYGEVYFRDWED